MKEISRVSASIGQVMLPAMRAEARAAVAKIKERAVAAAIPPVIEIDTYVPTPDQKRRAAWLLARQSDKLNSEGLGE
jgi:hypothetical protein